MQNKLEEINLDYKREFQIANTGNIVEFSDWWQNHY